MKIIFLIPLIICALFCNAQIITTVAGSGGYGGDATGGFSGDDSLATNAQLSNPLGVTLDSRGNLYISDDGNARIRKVDTNGLITTISGNGTYGFSGDGGPASAAVFGEMPYIFISNDTNLYLPDGYNSRIRLINLNTGIINTFAGSGIAGYAGDGGLATLAELCTPDGIYVDKDGNIYYSDDACSHIRKINTLGIVSLVAGDTTTGFAGNGGQATGASLQHPFDVAVDYIGNVYISDGDNNRIRKVDTNGIITTYGGLGWFGYSGDNGPATAAKIEYPEGIAVDGAGNVYFADCWNNVIRKIDTSGIVTTVVGNGYGAVTNGTVGGFSGDGGPATDAELNSPAGIAFDKEGNLYIADWYNNRIRKVTNVGVPLSVKSEKLTVKNDCLVYPNPATNKINIDGVMGCEVVLYDVVGREVKSVISPKNNIVIDVSTLQKGIYFVEITDKETGEKTTKKIIKI